jgi:hypothetical protein
MTLRVSNVTGVGLDVAGGGGAADGGEAYAVVHGVDDEDGWWLVGAVVISIVGISLDFT